MLQKSTNEKESKLLNRYVPLKHILEFYCALRTFGVYHLQTIHTIAKIVRFVEITAA